MSVADRTVQFYAVAKDWDGRPAQLLVRRTMRGPVLLRETREWTGVVYKNDREAFTEMRRLNCGGRL